MGTEENEVILRRFYEEIDRGNLDAMDQLVAEGDRVITRLTAIGSHERDLSGIPRTGNALSMSAIAIHRVVDGRLVEKWSERDVLGFLQQLEVIPRPPGGDE
jgi:predicted ester cyclase